MSSSQNSMEHFSILYIVVETLFQLVILISFRNSKKYTVLYLHFIHTERNRWNIRLKSLKVMLQNVLSYVMIRSKFVTECSVMSRNVQSLLQKFVTECSKFGTECSKFITKCSKFVTACSKFGTEFSKLCYGIFKVCYGIFKVCYGIFKVCYGMFKFCYGMFKVCYGMFKVCYGMFKVCYGMFKVMICSKLPYVMLKACYRVFKVTLRTLHNYTCHRVIIFNFSSYSFILSSF